MMQSHKVEVKVGHDPWTSNSLCFASFKEAYEYGQDLASRWILVDEFRVVSSEDKPNYMMVDGSLVAMSGPPVSLEVEK